MKTYRTVDKKKYFISTAYSKIYFRLAKSGGNFSLKAYCNLVK